MPPRKATPVKRPAKRATPRLDKLLFEEAPILGANANFVQVAPESILLEAERLINGEKRSDYGGALESFTRIAELWSPVLGIDVTPEQVCLCMVGLKMARWVHGQQRDSVVDACGYLALIEHIQREREVLVNFTHG